MPTFSDPQHPGDVRYRNIRRHVGLLVSFWPFAKYAQAMDFQLCGGVDFVELEKHANSRGKIVKKR
jgi:hypothetical protein